MNSLKKALAILLGADGNGRIENREGQNIGLGIYDYSDPDDFEKLWRIQNAGGRELAAQPPEKYIIIVWSRMPLVIERPAAPSEAADAGRAKRRDEKESHVTLTGVLTPVDCVIAYVSQIRANPIPNVLVLDTGLAETPNQFSVEHFDSLKPEELPWLRVERDISLAKIVNWFGEAKAKSKTNEQEITKESAEKTRKAVDRFLQVIRANLTQEPENAKYDHHAIANLVGPMILRGEAATPSLHAQALLALLQACGLAVEAKTPDPTVWSLPDDVELILVDDQADDGWKQWVEESLNTPLKQVIYDPTELVELIDEGFSVGDEKSGGRDNINARVRNARTGSASTPSQFVSRNDLRFRLFDGIAKGKTPIVLLDLRLFAGKPEKERAFYEKLLKLVDTRFTKREDLAWDDSRWTDSTYFQDARAAVTGKLLRQGSPEHLEALTWLPRVLALADMSLPIVLFSSTERKGIVTPLLPYRNIFLSFQKPSLLTLHAPLTRDSAVDRLRETIGAAAEFGKMRQKCKEIYELAETVPPAGRPKAEGLHVELYLDETLKAEDSGFAVGGVFAVFNSVEAADRFEDVCVEQGLRYFEEEYFKVQNRRGILDKFRDTGARQLRDAVVAFGPAHLDLGYVRVKRDDGREMEEAAKQEPDSLLHQMLSGLIELFCAESLPAILRQRGVVTTLPGIPAADVTFSVYIATRMLPDPSDPGDFTYRENIEIHSFSNGGRGLRSMGGRDAFPIVRNALSIRGRFPLQGVRRAVAVSLPYGGLGPGKKSDVDQAVHHGARKVSKFEQCHVEIPQPKPPCTVYGNVLNLNHQRNTVYIGVKGIPGRVECYRYNWGGVELRDLTRDRLVKLEVKAIPGGHAGSKLQLADPSDAAAWLKNQGAQLSPSFYEGTSPDEWRPDFRALHYVADQIIHRSGPTYYSDLLSTELYGQFDSRWDEETIACLEAARSLDRDELSDALRLFQVNPHPFKTIRPRAAALLAGRLATKLHDCKGDVLWVDSPAPAHRSYEFANRGDELQKHKHPRGAKHRQNPLPGSTPNAGIQPAPQSLKAWRRALLAELRRQWRIKSFRWESDYLASDGKWHEKSDFDVRELNTGRIVIYARANVAADLEGFAPPNQIEWFENVNQPAGNKYRLTQ